MVKPARTGAARVADVPPDILVRLNAGEIEAATLSENLATDLAALMAAVLPDLASAAAQIDPKAGITRRMATAAQIIHGQSGLNRLDWLARHPSDLARGWGAYLVAADPAGSLPAKLRAMRPFADDAHFGVREWAWLALRPAIVAEPLVAIAELVPLAHHASENLRRFACEAIRPRGVWASHIKLLKDEPGHALPLLDPLRADPSRYVQDSVANWLNDAWKSQPGWVEALCHRWAAQSQADSTAYILKRALRSRT